MTATQDDTIADLQRIIAELRRERDAALAQRNSEFGERIEHQAATVDVLKAMSASPGDPQPVFDLIASSAAELCEARVGLWELREGQMHVAAHYGIHSALVEPLRRLFPRPADPSTVAGRAILERRVIHVRDVASDPMLSKAVCDLGGSAILGIPLLRDAESIGAIVLNGNPPGGFSDSQIELLKTFAEQAVIAIRSAETFRALQERTDALAQRNSEYGERIEQQSATIDVLKVMSASPGDTQPVFDLIVRRAQELCNGLSVGMFEFDGELVHHRASYGGNRVASEHYASMFPMAPNRASIGGRAILDKRVVHIPDTDSEPGLFQAMRNLGGRTFLSVPMLSNGVSIGAISLNSMEPGGFSESQVALLQTFAEQAVIAITSAETYRALQTRTADLQESLEYQTATSDVLKVISRSAFDLQPVLDTVVEAAARLCAADQAAIGRREGDKWRLAANFGFPPDYEAYYRERGLFSYAPDTPSVGARVAREGRIVHIDDVAAVPGYPEASIHLGKQRTSLGVPLLREGEVIGGILLARRRVEPFTDRQIELVSTFADQAVIAIENTRLLTEQREALEQQTATAEVLQVINSSPGNLTPVFEAMLEKAIRLCGGDRGVLWTIEGGRGRLAAARGLPAEFVALLRERGESGTNSPLQRVVQGEWLIEFPDTVEEFSRSGDPHAKGAVEAGVRSAIWVAIVKEGVTVGAFAIGRSVIGTFSDKQIALLQNFAAQAVIAMENARLLTETREALEQQTATAEVLQVINASPGDLTPVFDAILEKAHRLCGAAIGSLTLYDGTVFRTVATRGYPEQYSALLREPFPPGVGQQALIRGDRLFHSPDMQAVAPAPGVEARVRLFTGLGLRTGLAVPLRKDGVLLGVISASRLEVRPFSDKEIALLENFAAQAVIAMENARLITEQREALEQQTATAEVLGVINSSPGDLAPVFDAMLDRAMRLCDGAQGTLWMFDGERMCASATAGYSSELAEQLSEWRGIHPFQRRLSLGERVFQIVDLAAEELYRSGNPLTRTAVDVAGIRTVVFVALVKDATTLGGFTIGRREVRAFTGKQIALLENFAAQAVIAMENARLITEQREALEQQTATAEVLQVINANPGDLTPVFDAMLEKAMHLCGAAFGLLFIFDGEHFRSAAQRGVPAAYAEFREKYPLIPTPGGSAARILATKRPDQVLDQTASDLYKAGNANTRAMVDLGGVRTSLSVPLLKDTAVWGFITVYRQEVRAFSDKQIALLENFAAQAVIAMENARLITEQREALEQQTATAEVLQVINANPGNLAPVFDAVLEKAMLLCGAAFGSLYTYDGERLHSAAHRGVPTALVEFRAKYPPSVQTGGSAAALLTAKHPIHIVDMKAETFYRTGDAINRAIVDLGGALTTLTVPLLKDDTVLGAITIYRQEVRAFSDKQITLLENFAAQAVIAMETARLLDEIRQRQEELRVTFENMGDSVAMFDSDLRLAAWNRNFQQILDLPDELLAERPSSTDFVRYLATRGEYGVVDVEGEVLRVTAAVGTQWSTERTRPDGRVIELRNNPVPGGGFVLIYSDITERKRSEEEIRAARDAAETALRDLKTAQANLIQAEKMASLGQLTAGIAHEIKNPLNFVNNFSALSTELIDELRDVLAPEPLGETARTEVDDLTALLKGNLEKVVQHGQRADGIVRSMLDHSRGSSGERRMVDLNALIDEALNLAYHGARAQDQSFNITLERDFGEGIAPIEVNPQDITRVFLNLFANGFYAVMRRARSDGDAGFAPTLKVTTSDAGEALEIRVRDNGIGIPGDIRDKLFQPFFTTKPTGEGTGLGLSITYDIVTQQHGGHITVDSIVGDYSEFTIRLPRNP